MTNLDDDEDYKRLKSLCNRPTIKSDVLNKEIKYKKRKAVMEINNSSKGIFLLHLIYEEFNPWILIKGIKKLFKADFPKEIFQEDFLPKNWSSTAEEKIRAVVK